MATSTPLDLSLLPGGRALLAVHARELPQRDDLCGAFCAALALRAAGIDEHGGGPLDQDAVALAAGSVVSALADAGNLPHGERGRRDYRLALPFVDDPAVSGTTAAGLVEAVAELAGDRLAAIPYSGPWTAGTLGGLFDAAAALERPVTLVANLATRHLWGGHPRADQLLDYLLGGDPSDGDPLGADISGGDLSGGDPLGADLSGGAPDGPPPDWDVGHFVCIFGRLRGPGGSLYGVADTYPSLGAGGVHLQPQERLAAAIERRDMPAGGVIAIASVEDAPALRAAAGELGLAEGVWDNGTVTPGTPR
jgi:hypothetical protein